MNNMSIILPLLVSLPESSPSLTSIYSESSLLMATGQNKFVTRSLPMVDRSRTLPRSQMKSVMCTRLSGKSPNVPFLTCPPIAVPLFARVRVWMSTLAIPVQVSWRVCTSMPGRRDWKLVCTICVQGQRLTQFNSQWTKRCLLIIPRAGAPTPTRRILLLWLLTIVSLLICLKSLLA